MEIRFPGARDGAAFPVRVGCAVANPLSIHYMTFTTEPGCLYL